MKVAASNQYTKSVSTSRISDRQIVAAMKNSKSIIIDGQIVAAMINLFHIDGQIVAAMEDLSHLN